MTHPSEWPTLFEDYPVVSYLQHSEWAADVYRRYFGRDRCDVWPVGIDTKQWQPSSPSGSRPVDFLIYDKLRWDKPRNGEILLNPISALLARLGLSSTTLVYGSYEPAAFHAALATSKAMIFLSSHESQGIACGEALACDVPVFAWDPGRCMDPERSAWGDVDFPTTSVPYFDERCGARFADFGEFEAKLPAFVDSVKAGSFAPREYILENLTVEKCSSLFVEILRRRLG
jgi:glycosyltransferase involved in cell wall biosynthesis